MPADAAPSAHTPSRGRLVAFAAGACGIALLLFAYLAATWRRSAAFADIFDICPKPFCDFTMYYYPMGEAVFRTGLPVEGFLYSPFIAILLSAFPPLGLTASMVLWGILQALSVVLFLLLFRWLVPAGLPIQLLFVALALFSYPLLLNPWGGQVSVFMTVAVLGVLVLDARGRRAAGGSLLALAASFKFYPVLFLAPLAARRDLRSFAFGAAACGTFLLLVPGVLLGPGGTFRFYGALLDAFRASDWVTANPHSQFFPHLVLRLARGLGCDAHAYLPLLHVMAYGVAAANLALIFLIQRARLPHADLWSFQLVFLTLPFVFKTSWPHDFVFLSFTQAFLAWQLTEGGTAVPGTDAERTRSHVRTAVAACLLPSIVVSNIIFFNLIDNFRAYGFAGFLYWANLLLLVAMYVQLLPPVLEWLRRGGPGGASGRPKRILDPEPSPGLRRVAPKRRRRGGGSRPLLGLGRKEDDVGGRGAARQGELPAVG